MQLEFTSLSAWSIFGTNCKFFFKIFQVLLTSSIRLTEMQEKMVTCNLKMFLYLWWLRGATVTALLVYNHI